jgi:hypothetical protein
MRREVAGSLVEGVFALRNEGSKMLAQNSVKNTPPTLVGVKESENRMQPHVSKLKAVALVALMVGLALGFNISLVFSQGRGPLRA